MAPTCAASGLVVLAVLLAGCRTNLVPVELVEMEPGIGYAHQQVRWPRLSIHVVRVDRAARDLEFRTTRGREAAVGLSRLTDQAESMVGEWELPVVAVNGDFFQVAGQPYAGDPRGVQVVGGQFASAPSGGVVFWMDPQGEPRATNVVSRLEVTWPNGRRTPVGLDERRHTNSVVLYTPAIGTTTRTSGGPELTLEPVGNGPWLPLRVGDTITARVREVRDFGNAPLGPGTMVLSIDPIQTNPPPEVEVGEELEVSLATSPDLGGTEVALGGGPLLLHEGRRVELPEAPVRRAQPYAYKSMRQRHPRTALGWNDRYFYLVVVDGRQRKLSRGVTLERLADYMAALGCQEVVNLDGGGSSTLWWNGAVMNSPSDGYEREIANGLVVIRRINHPGCVDTEMPAASSDPPQGRLP